MRARSAKTHARIGVEYPVNSACRSGDEIRCDSTTAAGDSFQLAVVVSGGSGTDRR